MIMKKIITASMLSLLLGGTVQAQSLLSIWTIANRLKIELKMHFHESPLKKK